MFLRLTWLIEFQSYTLLIVGKVNNNSNNILKPRITLITYLVLKFKLQTRMVNFNIFPFRETEFVFNFDFLIFDLSHLNKQ